MNTRQAAIIAHLTSLPSSYGIGSLGKDAYVFADSLKRAGIGIWQLLPIGPTGYGDSPYQSLSSFAGNHYLIDLDLLCEMGLLVPEDYRDILWGDNPAQVDFGLLYEHREKVLKIAFGNVTPDLWDEIDAFRQRNADWLEDYALFMAIKNQEKGAPFFSWEEDLRNRDPKAIQLCRSILHDEIGFWVFTQYLFDCQYSQLKKYVNSIGLSLMGDLPIYVSADSADVWANRSLFILQEDGSPRLKAGVPPDAFSTVGQLWGNPVYDWEAMEKDTFDFWSSRMRAAAVRFDILRVDHFRGFCGYWAVPPGEETAQNGRWLSGPGKKLFDAIQPHLGDLSLVVEDLGVITDDVRSLMNELELPGMAVLQFAFNPDEESAYLPHRIHAHTVLYTGTHDNDTIIGWLQKLSPESDAYCKSYLALGEEEGLNWGVIRGAWSSAADIAVTTLQDVLGLGTDARMNTPGTAEGNWCWRMLKGQLDEQMIRRVANLCTACQR